MILIFYLTLMGFLSLAPTASAGSFPGGGAIAAECSKAKFSKTCLVTLMTYKCGDYRWDFYRTGQCLDAARAMADILDIAAPSDSDSLAFVAFPQEVHDLLNEPFTQRYLQALQSQLERGRLGEGFDLWEFTLRACRGNTAIALRLIGVLLQDTSLDKLHLSYIGEKYGDQLPEKTLGALSNVLDLLEPGQLEKNDSRHWLKLYPTMPNGGESHFRANLYHFYTISYLAMRLDWKIHNQRLSRFLPLLLEATYKFRKIAPGRWPLFHPGSIDPTAFGDELTDLYTAYLGARWAVGASAKRSLGFEEFTRRMAGDPFHFLKSLYVDFQ